MTHGERSAAKFGSNSMVLTTAQVADLRAVNPRTIQRMVKTGVLNPLRGYSRPLRFSAVEVAKALFLQAL